MNLFQLNCTGNLVADATFKQLEGERSPINFSLAVNVREEETLFLAFTYWVKEPKVLEYLKKGQKVAVSSSYAKEEKYTNKEGVTVTKLTYIVDKIDLCGGGNKE